MKSFGWEVGLIACEAANMGDLMVYMLPNQRKENFSFGIYHFYEPTSA